MIEETILSVLDLCWVKAICLYFTASHRVAVFCLMKIGTEIFDTEMVIVDRTMTDICFEGVTVL